MNAKYLGQYLKLWSEENMRFFLQIVAHLYPRCTIVHIIYTLRKTLRKGGGKISFPHYKMTAAKLFFKTHTHKFNTVIGILFFFAMFINSLYKVKSRC